MDKTMKIVTLNIRHGGGTRVPVILEYLDSQNGDVIVLTEFRENANATVIPSGLLAQGLAHFAAASIAPKANSVCICSRLPFVPRTYPNIPVDDRRRLVGARFKDIEIFGVYFAQNQAKASLFQFLIDGAYKPAELSHLFIGDLTLGCMVWMKKDLLSTVPNIFPLYRKQGWQIHGDPEILLKRNSVGTAKQVTAFG
jgi:exodeoxyribonuclease-3